MTKKSVLPPLWEVPQEFRNRLGDQAGRQRAMFHEGHLLLVLHRPPKEDEAERQGRFFWRSPDGTWTASELRGGPIALQMHLEEYEDSIGQYDRREEEAGGVEDRFKVLAALGPLHRAARHLHQTLQEAREMCPEDRHLIVFRDRAYAIERAAELLYQEVKNSLDLAVAKRAEEQAANGYRMATSDHRLNLLAAFFFPFATLSALFGVHLDHGLEHVSAPLPFLGVLCVGLVLGFLLKSFVSHSRREGISGRAAARRDPHDRNRTKPGVGSGR